MLAFAWATVNVLPTIGCTEASRESLLEAVAAVMQVERDAGKVTKVAPLPHMFVVKDLVVDMSNFYAQYKSINPFLQKRENP